MMNLNEKLEIAKRLHLSSEMEMSRDDLEKLLEDELTKPEAEMDAELVQLILELLEDTPTQEQQRESWQQIDKQLSSKRQWRPAVNGLTRIAAIGVILVAILFATYGTAQAFNWEFLLRLMKPFAETFMLYSGDKPETTPVPEASEVYGDAMCAITQTEFTSLADCPNEIAGYPAKPVWMPERYAYLQGTIFSDPLLSTVTHVYTSDDGTCIIDVSVFNPEGGYQYFYEYEKTPENYTYQYLAGYKVAIHRNSEGAIATVSWVVDTAHYSLTGAVTEDEIVRILSEMMQDNRSTIE